MVSVGVVLGRFIEILAITFLINIQVFFRSVLLFANQDICPIIHISRSSNSDLFTPSNRTSWFSVYEPLILEPEILEDIRWVLGSLAGCLFNTSSSRVYCRSNVADSFTNALFS